MAISGHTGTAPTTVASRWEADERSQTPSVLTRECAGMNCWREAEGETEMSGYRKLWEERNLRGQLMGLGSHSGMMWIFWN